MLRNIIDARELYRSQEGIEARSMEAREYGGQ
jgi:hypothetical protein